MAAPPPSDGLTTLEKALKTIVTIYHQYSEQDSKDDHLSQKEMTALLKNQAPRFLSVCDRNHSGYTQKLFKETDRDKNRKLSFEEFTVILAKLADDAHRILHGDDRCDPDRH